MTEHPTANREIRELASLFAAGALPPNAKADFQEQVKNCGVGKAHAMLPWTP
jgi:hypothetical protein